MKLDGKLELTPNSADYKERKNAYQQLKNDLIKLKKKNVAVVVIVVFPLWE